MVNEMTQDKVKTRDENKQSQVWNFKGRFADYMRELCKSDEYNYKTIFDEIYHGYAFCALYGLLKGRRHIYDPDIDNPNDSPVSGFRWAYADTSGLYAYDNIRKMILLYSKPSATSFDEKIDLALRFDYTTNEISDPMLLNKSKYKENSDLIDEYVLGGLDLLYEKINDISSIEAMIDFMRETLEEIQTIVKSVRK